MKASTEGRARVSFSANTSWYLFNHHRNLLLAFQESGYEVHILSPDDQHARKLEALGFKHHALPIRSAAKNPWGELRVFFAYIRLYRRLRPSIAFHFTIKCNLYGSLAARLVDVPHVSSISGLGRAFDARGLFLAALLAGYRLTQRTTARIIFQKSADRDALVAWRIATPDQALILAGSGVDLQRFVPKERIADPHAQNPHAQDRPFTFVFAGRLLWEKGFPYLPDALRMLRSEGLETRCLVYGFLDDSDPQYVPRAQVDAWQAEGLLEYRGPADDIREAYRFADAVVLPTFYREGIPKVLLEAAAMGVPAIASDRPGCREALVENENGLICAARDARSLADALAAMARMAHAEPERFEAMGRAARTLAEARFDERRIAEGYLKVARTVIDGKG